MRLRLRVKQGSCFFGPHKKKKKKRREKKSRSHVAFSSPPPPARSVPAMPPPDASMASSTFTLHPDFLINFRHQTRAKDQAARPSPPADVPRVFGCVVGTQRGPTVEIVDSFDLPASATRRRAFLDKRRKKGLSPDLDVLGWYSTGTGREDTDTHEIHKALMDDANGTRRRDFYLLVVDHDGTDDLSSQIDLHVTVYDCVLHATRPIFVKSNCTLDFLDPDRIFTDLHKGCFLCCSNRAADSGENALPPGKEGGGGTGTHGRRRSVRTMLLETPSGFAMFSVDARFLQYTYEIWPWFARLSDARIAVSTLGFIKLDNKSLAWDADVGPGEDLAKFILRFITTHTQALIVPDPQFKYVIEKKLKVGCFFDAHIVRELMWGLNYVLHEFVPEERDNLTDECHLPLMSKELEKIRAYGFSVSPRMMDMEFISTVGHLYSLEFTSESLSVSLRRTFAHRFPGSHRMSDLEFAKAIADGLHSYEEMIIAKDDRYSTQDIVRFTDFILAAPELKNHAISRLKRMEAAASEDPLAIPDKKDSCLECMEPVASEDCLVVPERKRSLEFWGKAEAKGKDPKLQVKIEIMASKSKAVEKNKKGDGSDDDSDSNSCKDDSVDGVHSYSRYGEEEEERPKKPETGKKRAARSALKMPASNKKAKVATQHRLARRHSNMVCKLKP